MNVTHNHRILALALLPVGVGFVLTLSLGVNFPYVDDWSRASFMARATDGDVGMSDLWVKENVHRSFVPRALASQLARWTSWNHRSEMLTSLVCGCLALLAMGRVLARESAWLVPLAALFLFSLHSWKNFLWGIQTNVALANLFTIAAIALLAAPTVSLVRVIGTSVAGALASYSFLSGFLVWPVGAFVLLFRPCESKRKRWTLIGAWLVAGLTVTAVHMFVAATRTPPGPEASSGLGSLPEFVTRFFGAGLLGRAGDGSLFGAGAVGHAGLVLALLWLVLRARARASAVGLAGLGLYALASAYAIGFGRTATMGHAASSRYTAFSGIAWLVVIATLGIATRDWAHRPRLGARVVVVAMVAVMLLHYPGSLDRARSHTHDLRVSRDAFAEGRGLSLPALQGTFGGNPAPWLPTLGRRLDELRSRGLSFYADLPVDRRTPPATASSERIAVKLVASASKRYTQLVIHAENGVPAAAAALIVMDKGELAAGGMMPILRSLRARDGTRMSAFDQEGRVTFEVRIAPARAKRGLELMVLSLDRRGRVHASPPVTWKG